MPERLTQLILASVCVMMVLASIPSSDAFAQVPDTSKTRAHIPKPEIPARPEDFRIGMRFALAHFSGDVQSGSAVFKGARNPFTPGADLFFGYRFTPFVDFAHIGLKGLVGYRRLVGRQTDYQFINYMFPVSVSLSAEFFPMALWRPYGSAGVSYLPYKLEVTRNNVDPRIKQNYTGSESRSTIGFPLRAGVVYSITRAVDIEISFEKELTLSDRMDGVLSQMRDNLETFGIGFLYYFYDARTSDTDYDGLSDEYEESLGMEIRNRDQDDDDLIDGEEVNEYNTSPFKKDTDNDRLDDYSEIKVYRTDPTRVDTDRDGISDYEEVQKYKTNPLKTDSDDDTIPDKQEIQLGTNPNDADTDNDAIPDPLDKCPLAAENINLFEDEDGCPDEVTEVPETLEMGQVVIIENIEFETGSAKIKNTNIPTLENAFQAMKNTPSLRVEIGGHTDNTGDYDKNVKLSLDRADAIKQILVAKGIEPDRIAVKGYGPDIPLAPNDTPEGRSRNRRIEFKILFIE